MLKMFAVLKKDLLNTLNIYKIFVYTKKKSDKRYAETGKIKNRILVDIYPQYKSLHFILLILNFYFGNFLLLIGMASTSTGKFFINLLKGTT